RGAIHRDPVIELSGAHPTMFATLRKLGLINEQIAWKQRFFVPIEEERGNAVIAALLEQFPVIATEDEEADSDMPSAVAMPSANATQPVDRETWLIEPVDVHANHDVTAEQPISLTESESDPTSYESGPMLQTLPPDYRTAAIQIGFNFAESESV
ncbi:MAG: hypothetical protein WAV47_09945, partial [Blastocatellia bacterium]